MTVVSPHCMDYKEESNSADTGLHTWNVGNCGSRFKRDYPMKQFTGRLPKLHSSFLLPLVGLKNWDLGNHGASYLILESIKIMSRCSHGIPPSVFWFELQTGIPQGECLPLSGEVVWYLCCPSVPAGILPG